MTVFPMTVLRFHWHTRGQPRPLPAIAQAIRNHSRLRTWTAKIAAEQDKKRRDKMKKHLLPAIIITGQFAYRSHNPTYKVKGKELPNSHKLNGLYAFDIDGHDQDSASAGQLALLRSPLRPHIALAYTSASKRGFRFAIHGPLAPDVKAYAETWDAIAALIDQHLDWPSLGLENDRQGRVACMPFMLAHDLFCYANAQAEPVEPPPLPPKPKPKAPYRPPANGTRTKLHTAEDVHRALGDRSKGPRGAGWYATTDEFCHGGSSDNALSYRTDDEGMLQTTCFGSAACDSMTIRHALQAVTGLVLCICRDCRRERSQR